MGKFGNSFRLACVILLFLCFIACSKREKEIDLNTESLRIYNLLIYDFYSNNDAERVFINCYSQPVSDISFNDQFFSVIHRSTLNDFIKKNKKISNIASDFPLDSKYHFLSFKDIRHDKEYTKKFNNFMRRLRRLSPYSDKKIIEFSKIGFNEKADQALVTFVIYRFIKPDEPDSQYPNRDVILPFPGCVFLEKKLGPSPHIWTIRNWNVIRY